MATSPDGFVLPPVFEEVSLCAPVAGEHGWEGAVSFMSCLVGPWPMAGWPLCEQSAGLDGPSV